MARMQSGIWSNYMKIIDRKIIIKETEELKC